MNTTSDAQHRPAKGLTVLAIVQGLYFLATGLWPIFHITSFMAVTGPKTDLWLVRTVGVLVTAIGATFLLAAVRGRITLEVGALAIGSALGLAAIDIIYVSLDTIDEIYLLDAALEMVLAGAWVVLALLGRRSP